MAKTSIALGNFYSYCGHFFAHGKRKYSNKKAAQKISHFGIIGIIFVIGLVLPFIEEMAFRLSLVVKKKFLMISAGLLVFYLLGGILRISYIDKTLTFIGIFIIIGLVLWQIYHKYYQIEQFINKNHRFWLHFLCISFALAHWWDYGLIQNPKMALLSISGALLFAYYSSYVRLKYGFGYAVFIHCFHNGLIISPLIIKEILT